MFVIREKMSQRMKAGYKEHLWLSGTVEGKQAFLGLVYLCSGSESKEQNNELVNRLKNDINEFIRLGEVILVGDMNAHIGDLDEYTDYKGSLLPNLCEEQKLIIVNRDYICGGEITCQCRNKQSSIDHGLLSESSYERLDRMAIDEDRSNSLGTDYNRAIMTVGKGAKLRKKPALVRRTNLTDGQVAKTARRIECKIAGTDPEAWGYNALIGPMETDVNKEKGKDTWNENYKSTKLMELRD